MPNMTEILGLACGRGDRFQDRVHLPPEGVMWRIYQAHMDTLRREQEKIRKELPPADGTIKFTD